jgi:hypothetical protein
MDRRTPTLGKDPTGFVPGPIYRFLAADHVRLDHLLRQAVARASEIDPVPFAEFRKGLLKHIGMEEKILLPAARRPRGGEALPVAAKLRLDHGALAALLVPTPTARIIAAIRCILEKHNGLEEGPDGVYAACDLLLGDEAEAILARLRSAPEVPVNPHVDKPLVFDAARRALDRAGYDFDIAPEIAAR